MVDREEQLQGLFTALSRVNLDDLDAVEKAVTARRDYLIHCKLLSMPIGMDVLWQDNDGPHNRGKLIHHYRKSLLVMHEMQDGAPTVEGEEDYPQVNVPYEQLVWV